MKKIFMPLILFIGLFAYGTASADVMVSAGSNGFAMQISSAPVYNHVHHAPPPPVHHHAHHVPPRPPVHHHGPHHHGPHHHGPHHPHAHHHDPHHNHGHRH
ncbi:MAG: hypothetical protein J6I35_06875 [Ruminobacter sp.]|uniref:hypothetical protein n=1 Tax=Ruminobacter sp. TaxID=2774296 RepID=UPI001B45F300|nr:hypothetical protein [Ruminobacter sp.]MBP3749255.1 hypothetical protein [Ruminobacter sp.]